MKKILLASAASLVIASSEIPTSITEELKLQT